MGKTGCAHLFGLVTRFSSLVTLLFLVVGCRVGDATSAPSGATRGQRIHFTDVTAAAGINFRHSNGAEGRKYMPETMGSGCAFLDYDNDGWQDILLINGEPWGGVRRSVFGVRSHLFRHRTPNAEHPTPTMALYRNDGAGRFHDVTAAVGLDVPMYGMGVAVGDWDNDGFDDLAVTALGGVYLFHNEEGRRFGLMEDERRRDGAG